MGSSEWKTIHYRCLNRLTGSLDPTLFKPTAYAHSFLCFAEAGDEEGSKGELSSRRGGFENKNFGADFERPNWEYKDLAWNSQSCIHPDGPTTLNPTYTGITVTSPRAALGISSSGEVQLIVMFYKG